MGDLEGLRDQVAGILSRAQIPFSTNEDGTEYGVYRGSAAVFINFNESIGEPVVSLSSPVLIDIEMENEGFGKTLVALNELNCNYYLAKFSLYPGEGLGVLRLEYDLIGSQLQASELMAALDQVSGISDTLDEQLQEALGGKIYEAKMEELQGSVDT